MIDTSLCSPEDFREPGQEQAIQSLDYRVKARSIVVLRSESLIIVPSGL